MGAADDRPDTGVAAAFRDAALRLSRAERNDEAWGAASADAAEALVLLADADPAADDLRTFLSPHDMGAVFTWTVSRYRSRDVTPIESRVYEHPGGAVLWCVDFVDPEHVSTELVVSDGAGLRWMALVGREGRTAFQLPDVETVQSDGDDSVALAATLAHWRALLISWEPRPAEMRPAVVRTLPPRQPRGPTLGQRVEGRLEEIEQQQVELLDAVAGVRERLGDLDVRLDSLHDDLARVLKLLGDHGNPTVTQVARALRERWSGLSR